MIDQDHPLGSRNICHVRIVLRLLAALEDKPFASFPFRLRLALILFERGGDTHPVAITEEILSTLIFG